MEQPAAPCRGLFRFPAVSANLPGAERAAAK